MKVFVRLMLAVIVIAALLLTGCQCGPVATEPATTEAPTEAPTAVPTRAPTAAPTEAPTEPGAEPATIVYWSYWTEAEPQAEIFKQWIADFEAEHPNIKVEVQWNGRQNPTLVRTALEGGAKIDLVDAGADELAASLMKDDLLLPLNDYLELPAYDDASKTVADAISAGALNLHSPEGQHYVIPYNAYVVLFWYNKNIFNEAGVEPPSDWDELLTVNQAILDAGYKGIAVESDIASYQQIYLGYYVQRVKGSCGFLLETIADESGEMWRDPVYLEAAEAVKGLWDAGYIPEEGKGNLFPAGQQTLGYGETAMELVGSWLPNEIRDIAEGTVDWGAFGFPAVPGGAGANTDLMGGTGGMAILKASEHPDEAFEFMRFFTTAERSQQYAEATLSGVPIIGAEWPDVLADGAGAIAEAQVMFGWFCDAAAHYPEFVNNVFNVNWTDLFVGTTTPEQFVEEMATDAAEYWAAQ